MLQGPVNEEGRLLLHPLGDGMGHRVVGLRAPGTVLHAVLIVYVLLGRPETEEAENHPQLTWCRNGRPTTAAVSMVY